MLCDHLRIKLEDSNNKLLIKCFWKLNNTLLNNLRVKEGILWKVRNFKLNDNENASYHKLWVQLKQYSGEFVTLYGFIRKEERHKIDDLSFQL